MKSILKLIFAQTPSVGRKIAVFGAILIAIAGAIQTFQADISIELPLSISGYINYAYNVLYALGTFLTGAGITSTVKNPDEILKKEP